MYPPRMAVQAPVRKRPSDSVPQIPQTRWTGTKVTPQCTYRRPRTPRRQACDEIVAVAKEIATNVQRSLFVRAGQRPSRRFPASFPTRSASGLDCARASLAASRSAQRRRKRRRARQSRRFGEAIDPPRHRAVTGGNPFQLNGLLDRAGRRAPWRASCSVASRARERVRRTRFAISFERTGPRDDEWICQRIG